jgi:protocatechuate 3,4-dioxygenase, alpha subunit
MSEVTPSQTVGPYFAYGLTPRGAYAWSDLCANNLVTPDAAGERIRIEGQVTDAKGIEINDAMIEIWQADAQGRYAHPRDNRSLPNTSFKGFGRVGTDSNGFYFFDTIKPGSVPGPDGKMQAPHILVGFYSRGLLTHLYTRIYFADDPANASDPILSLVPQDRRDTLIAKRQMRGEQAVYRFDIRFQGDDETVFFDI